MSPSESAPFRDAALEKMARFQAAAADSDDEREDTHAGDEADHQLAATKRKGRGPSTGAIRRATAAYGDDADVTSAAPPKDLDVSTVITGDMLRDATGGEADLASAVSADLHNRGVGTMLHGALQHCGNLRSLDLSFNAVDAVAGLEPLTALRELKLYNNELTTVGGLRHATSLQALQLQNNQIGSLEGVDQLKHLRSLRVDGNPLGPSARIVGRLTALTQLDISGCGLERLDGFATLVNLEELNVSRNRLKALDVLGACKKLQELDASDNSLPDASLVHLTPLARLDVLSLEGNALTSLEKLPVLEDLTELSVARNAIKSLRTAGAPLGEKTPFLEIFDVAENRIDDVNATGEALRGLQYLTELRLQFNPCAGGGSSGGLRARKKGGGRPGMTASKGGADSAGARQPPAVRPTPPSGAGPMPEGGRRRQVGVGSVIHRGGTVGGGRIRTRAEASWEASRAGGGGGKGKGSGGGERSDAEEGWSAGTPAWVGLSARDATASALRYRRDVVRVLPSLLYVDDVAVGDAERGPEVSPEEAEAAAEMAAFKAKHGIPTGRPAAAADGRPSTPAGFGFYGVNEERPGPLGRPSSRSGPADRRPGTPGASGAAGAGAPLMKVRPQSARRGGTAKILPASQYEDVAAEFTGQMESYKEQMTGLLSRLRSGLQKTPQEAVAALRADGTFDATLDNPATVPSRMLPPAPVMHAVPAFVCADAERWQLETDAALRAKHRQHDAAAATGPKKTNAEKDDAAGEAPQSLSTSRESKLRPFANLAPGGGRGAQGKAVDALTAAAAGRAGSMPRVMAEAGLAARAALDQYSRCFPAPPETPSPIEAPKGGGKGGGGGSPGIRTGIDDRVAAAMAAAEAAAADSDDDGGEGATRTARGFYNRGYLDDDHGADRSGGYDPERDTSPFDESDVRALARSEGWSPDVCFGEGGQSDGDDFSTAHDLRSTALTGYSTADRRPLRQRVEEAHQRRVGVGAEGGSRGPSPSSSFFSSGRLTPTGGRVTPTGFTPGRTGAIGPGLTGGYSTQRFRPPSAGKRSKVGGVVTVAGAGTGAGSNRSVPRANKFKGGRASPLAAAGLTDILAAADAAAAQQRS